MAKAEVKKDSLKSKNVVEVSGKLKQMNLEKKINKNKKNYIGGSVTIQYGKETDKQVTVKVYVEEFTQAGTVAKAYGHLESLIKKHTTMDAATEEDLATVIRFYGSQEAFSPTLQLNEYMPENGEYSSKPEVFYRFGNVAIDKTESSKFKSEFDLVIFLTKKPTMELDKEQDETGRLVIEGLYVDFENQVKPLTFLVEDSEVVDGMSELNKNDTIEIWGNIKIANITEVKKKASAFGGKAHTDETTTNVSELIIIGGEPIEDDDKSYIEPTFVKRALVEREGFLANLGNDTETTKSKSGGFTKGTKKKAEADDSNDVPF